MSDNMTSTQSKRDTDGSSNRSTGSRISTYESNKTPATNEFRDSVADAAHDIRGAASAAPAAAREQFNRASEAVAERAESMEENLTAAIREKPMKSMLMALGIGMFAGLFLFRR